MTSVGADAGAGTGAGDPPNKLLIQPKNPLSAGCGAAIGAGAGVGAATGVDTLVAAGSGRGNATGAGASGSTPLITGVCLLVGSCERRVTEVGSSISSAIL